MPTPALPRRIAACLLVTGALAGCAGGAALPPPVPAASGPPPALLDLRSLPAPPDANDPGPALLRRAQGLRSGRA